MALSPSIYEKAPSLISVTVAGILMFVMLFPLKELALIVVTLLGIVTEVAFGTVLFAAIAVTLKVY